MDKDQPKSKSSPLIWLGVMALSGALALLVFISLYEKGTSVGEVTPQPEKVVKAESGASALDLQMLKISTAELVSKGQALFQINCASCHGPSGHGDGPRAAELNPRPRNFHQEKFRYGALASQIFNTVTNGSPGTSMPSFALLPVEDRWALVHFVRSQIPNPPQEAEGQTAQAKESKTTPARIQAQAPPAPTPPAQVPEGPRIPIQLAMQRIAQPVSPATSSATAATLALERQGTVLFSRYCMPCHGPYGESRQTVYLLRINPERFVRSGNLQNPNAVWVRDKKRFVAIVTKGFPGHLMPGFKSLSQSDQDALYAHVLNLALSSKK